MFYCYCGKNYDVSFFRQYGNEDAFVGRIDSYEFRSCGLWGHPLSNSCILSLMMPFILLQNEFSIKKKICYGV